MRCGLVLSHRTLSLSGLLGLHHLVRQVDFSDGVYPHHLHKEERERSSENE